MCIVTLNQNDVGEACHPGEQRFVTVGAGQSQVEVSNMHHNQFHVVADKLTSIQITRTDPSIPCEVAFFKHDNFGGCYWSLSAQGTSATSMHFSGEAGDSASSFIVKYGTDPLDTKGQNRCTVWYHPPNCNRCSADFVQQLFSGWCDIS